MRSLAPSTRSGHPELLGGIPGVALADVRRIADLQSRFDSKYLVPVERLPALVEELSADLAVLDIDGARVTGYRSVYFDTPDLRTFRDHLQGRRRRFKIRTRRYGNSPDTMLEVKCKGQRGQTVKLRWPYDERPADQLGPTGLSLVENALSDHYGMTRPSPLQVSATTTFQRITLVRPASGERVTIDLDLMASGNTLQSLLGTQLAIVETKEATRNGDSSRELHRLGIRPRKISKYCIALAATRPDLRANPWRPVLREMLLPAGGQ